MSRGIRAGPSEIGWAQRHPDVPGEMFLGTDDGQLQVADDEEVLVVDYALVAGEEAPPGPLRFRDAVPVGRRLEAVVQGQFLVMLAAASGAVFRHDSHLTRG